MKRLKRTLFRAQTRLDINMFEIKGNSIGRFDLESKILISEVLLNKVRS